jgi:LysM repeat protein
MIRLWNHAATGAAACIALLAMIFSASCSSTSSGPDGLPSRLPDIQLSGSTGTPPHSMASYEYPFDSNGRYVSEWAAEGERRAGRSARATSADSSKWSKSHGGAASSKKVAGSSKSKTSTKAKPKPQSSGASSTLASSTSTKAKPKAESSGSGSTGASTGSSSKVSTSTKAKPKPQSGNSYTVKAGDTVERIARRHGTTTKKLMAANGMSSDFLKIGRVLKLP